MRFDLAKKTAEGFTLVELMIVVAIVGVLAVLAVYGVRKYLANAKTAEARNSLGQLSKDAATAVEREKGTSVLVTPGSVSSLMRSFCDSSTMVPASSSVSGQKYQSVKGDWSSGSATTGWSCLKFSIDEPQYYAYTYAATNLSAQNGGFTAQAFGDLNGDSNFSTFTVVGSAYSGSVAISPNIQETLPEE